MSEYWENIFSDEKILWGTEPSDSALFALNLFSNNNISQILIPGFGYGRNAKAFIDNEISVTGIEISKSAIKPAIQTLKLEAAIHQGSVNNMPYDNKLYGGVFCYSLINLLNSNERMKLIKKCYLQLNKKAYIVFPVISKEDENYKLGK